MGNEHSIKWHMHFEDTVADLKALIRLEEGVPPPQQRIVVKEWIHDKQVGVHEAADTCKLAQEFFGWFGNAAGELIGRKSPSLWKHDEVFLVLREDDDGAVGMALEPELDANAASRARVAAAQEAARTRRLTREAEHARARDVAEAQGAARLAEEKRLRETAAADKARSEAEQGQREAEQALAKLRTEKEEATAARAAADAARAEAAALAEVEGRDMRLEAALRRAQEMHAESMATMQEAYARQMKAMEARLCAGERHYGEVAASLQTKEIVQEELQEKVAVLSLKRWHANTMELPGVSVSDGGTEAWRGGHVIAPERARPTAGAGAQPGNRFLGKDRNVRFKEWPQVGADIRASVTADVNASRLLLESDQSPVQAGAGEEASAAPLYGVDSSMGLHTRVAAIVREKNTAESEKAEGAGISALSFLASHSMADWPAELCSAWPPDIRNLESESEPEPEPEPEAVEVEVEVSAPEWFVERGPVGRARALNATRHTGDSHTPGVSCSRTLPSGERMWPGIMDAKTANLRKRSSAKTTRLLRRAGVDMKNAPRPPDRRVLAHDPSTWAYLNITEEMLHD